MRSVIQVNGKTFNCPIDVTLQTIMGKWKAVILWYLLEGTMRYGELKKQIAGINHKMLTEQLRELEEDGIVKRTAYQSIPPKVEYELTELGRRIEPILEAMMVWGLGYADSQSRRHGSAIVPANTGCDSLQI